MKNFVMMSMQTRTKEAMSIILEHNQNRTNYGKDIDYLLDTKLDDNVHYTFKNLDELEAKRLAYLEANNRKDYQQKHIVEMVVALSYDKVEQYLNEGKTTKDIDRGFYNYAKNLEDKYKFNVMDISIHKDEGHIKEDGKVQFNYHCHLICHNFDFENGKAIASHLRRQDFRDMQTLAQDSFQEMNLDFERGLDKRQTFAKHLKRNEYVKKVKSEELKKIRIELDNVNNDLNLKREELKYTYNELNKQKNEIKEQRNLYEKNTNEYNDLNGKYKELQELEKSTRAEYRKIDQELKDKNIIVETKDTYLLDLKKDIKNLFEKHTKEVNPLTYKKHIEVENRREFFNDVIKKVQEPLNVQINEVEHLKRENKSLNDNLAALSSNAISKDEYIKVVRAFEIKHKESELQKSKISKYENFLKSKGLSMEDKRIEKEQDINIDR